MIDWKRWGPSVTGGPERHSWPDFSELLPVDVLPASNEEYFPPPPSKAQIAIMERADAETERLRRKFNMSRAQFVRTAAATAIGFWAIDTVRKGDFGTYGFARADSYWCDLEFDKRKGLATLSNLPGEFIFDVQSHHVDPGGLWRVSNPAIHAFFAAVWPQSSSVDYFGGTPPRINPDGSVQGGGKGGELDPIQNLSRKHYLKEMFLDSATSAAVLSVVPTSPDTNNPLPIAEAANTIDTVNDLANSKRAVMHAFVMPNRGGAGNSDPSMKPLFLQDELDTMMLRAELYSDKLRGWKTYCAWGDIPYASGWFLDTDTGMAFLEQVRKVSQKHPEIPPTVATHKGFALPGFDQRSATPRDIGPAAKAFPDVNIIVYHSGYDIGDKQGPYPGDAVARSDVNSTNALIKSLRENHWDASRFKEKGKTFGNVPNVWAELGSVWRDVANDPDQAAHLLGKLITHVGPKRIAWGTDSLWYGSPQPEIVALRRFEFTDKGKELYNLPYGLEGDVEDPTKPAPSPARTIRNGILGRNVAPAYRFDPDGQRRDIGCDAVAKIKDEGYVQAPGTERESAPLATNAVHGPRTRREVIKSMTESPWSP